MLGADADGARPAKSLVGRPQSRRPTEGVSTGFHVSGITVVDYNHPASGRMLNGGEPRDDLVTEALDEADRVGVAG